MICPHCGHTEMDETRPTMEERLTAMREALAEAVEVMKTYQQRFIDPDEFKVLDTANDVLTVEEEAGMQAVMRYEITGEDLEKTPDENGKWVPIEEHERIVDYLNREPERLRKFIALERGRLAKKLKQAQELELSPAVKELLAKYEYDVTEGKKK